MRKWMAALTACLLMLSTAYATEETATTAETTAPPVREAGTVNGDIRVWLQSLSNPQALGITLEGAYSVDGDRGFQFEPGTEIALGIDGGSLVLRVGGAAIEMGSGFSLLRHLDEAGNAGGAYIHESEKNTLYNGDLTFSARNGGIRVIVTLGVEDYLYGVVPYEMANAFPLEALKAQAVAARTYAMQRKVRNAGQDYDVVDTANDQVFKGLDERYAQAIAAVDETRGIVGMVGDAYAECFYSASNGGQTALATDVWGEGNYGFLDIRDDPYDLENPQSIEVRALIARDAKLMDEPLYALILEQVATRLHSEGIVEQGEAIGLGDIVSVEAVDPIYGGDSRQYGTIRFTIQPIVRRYLGEDSDTPRLLGEVETLEETVSVDLSFYDQVRKALDIVINAQRYDLVTVQETDEGFEVINRRYGHGVGLSQRGAEQMAQAHGMDYLQILAFYYPGLTIAHLTWEETALTAADALPDSLGYAAPRPTPVPTPGPLPPLQEGEYYAAVTVEGVDGTLRVRSGPSTEDAIIAEIRNGSRMIVEAETEDGWAKMKTAEYQGYVLMTYIQKEE